MALALPLITGCTKEKDGVMGHYGPVQVDESVKMTSADLLSQLQSQDSVRATITAPVSSVCQAKGCWMKLDLDGQEMLVRFKDYGFFVPMNSAGYNATVSGWAFADTISIADQAELIRDQESDPEVQKSKIEAINAPIVKLSFMAEAVDMDK